MEVSALEIIFIMKTERSKTKTFLLDIIRTHHISSDANRLELNCTISLKNLKNKYSAHALFSNVMHKIKFT